MKKKIILKLERDLKRRAKKMRLGKKRTGAYVYGTLRKLQGNPGKSVYRKILDLVQQSDLSFGRDVSVREWPHGGEDAHVVDVRYRKISDPRTGEESPDPQQKKAALKLIAKLEAMGKVAQSELYSDRYTYTYQVYIGKKKKNTYEDLVKKYRAIFDIAKTQTSAKIGNYRVDPSTAKAIVAVYNQIRPDNQEKFLAMSIPKMSDFALKAIKTYDIKTNSSKCLRKNPVNEALQILSQDQILAEYKKGGEGQQAKLMFTSKPMSGMSASQLVRKIGNYNNFSWRKVSPFLGKLHFMNQSLTLPMTFRVGREYSPTIYIENVDMPRYADRIIDYAYNVLKADEAHYMGAANRVRLWWD